MVDGSIIFLISTIIASSGMYIFLLAEICKRHRNRS